jgi:hypothetical protein
VCLCPGFALDRRSRTSPDDPYDTCKRQYTSTVSYGPVPLWKSISNYLNSAVQWKGRIQNCAEFALELVFGADCWCNRHCRKIPVVLEGFGGQVWPTFNRKPSQRSEFRIANKPLSKAMFLLCWPAWVPDQEFRERHLLGVDPGCTPIYSGTYRVDRGVLECSRVHWLTYYYPVRLECVPCWSEPNNIIRCPTFFLT